MSGLTYDICLIYLDDILVFSRSFEEHCDRLSKVFDRLERHTLKLKAAKCHLFQRKVTFLGHVVSDQGIECDPEKTAAIANWPRPTNVSEVRTFCGLASYYRAFVQNFAKLAKPLHQLTKKNACFNWSADCEYSFQELKKRLTTPPILVAPRDEGQYIVDCDASDCSVGSVIQQYQDGAIRVIAYASRALMEAERRYCITRRELLAVVFGLKKYRQHLLGRSIIVRTDHAALTHLMSTPEPIGQQGRWLDLLSEYDITIQHRPGRVHGNSDTLSRRPCERTGEMECRQCRRPVSDAAVISESTAPTSISHEMRAGVTAAHNFSTVNPVCSVNHSVVNADPMFNTVFPVTNVPSFTNTGVLNNSVGRCANNALVGVLPVLGPKANSVVVTADVHPQPTVRVATPAGGKATQQNNANSLSVQDTDKTVVKSTFAEQNNSAIYSAEEIYFDANSDAINSVMHDISSVTDSRAADFCSAPASGAAPNDAAYAANVRTSCQGQSAAAAAACVAMDTLAGGVVRDNAHAVAGAKTGGVAPVTTSAVGALHSDDVHAAAHLTNTVFAGQSPQSTERGNQPQSITPSLDANSITITESDIQQAQAADDCISPVIQLLLTGNTPPTGFNFRQYPEESRILLSQWDTLVIENGILYRRFCHPDGATQYLQLVLPAALRQPYCQRLHANLGHVGQTKSSLAFASRAYFPGWKTYLRLLVRNCTVCNLSVRASNSAKQAPLQPMQEFRPMAVLHVDLVGPLPSGKTSRGHTGFQYIMTVVDSATRYLWLVPLRRKTSDAVAAAIFEEVISQTTIPDALHTDRGTEFTNQVLQHLCKRLNISHFRTSAYHPECDGKCERTHYSLHNMLTKMLADNQSTWPDLLHLIAMAYNATVHVSTGHAPFNLFYSFGCSCPLDIMTGAALAEAANSADEYAYRAHNRLQQAFAYVRTETGKQATRAKKYYDIAVKPNSYKPGDLVLLYTPKKPKGKFCKWTRFWNGPYRILRCINSVNFVVQKSVKSKAIVVHANRLRPFHGDAMHGMNVPIEAPQLDFQQTDNHQSVADADAGCGIGLQPAGMSAAASPSSTMQRSSDPGMYTALDRIYKLCLYVYIWLS